MLCIEYPFSRNIAPLKKKEKQKAQLVKNLGFFILISKNYFKCSKHYAVFNNIRKWLNST